MKRASVLASLLFLAACHRPPNESAKPVVAEPAKPAAEAPAPEAPRPNQVFSGSCCFNSASLMWRESHTVIAPVWRCHASIPVCSGAMRRAS